MATANSTVDELRGALARIPDATTPPSPALAGAVDESVRYLGSAAALASLEADTYWPKWDSPWWHMLLLHELGEARRIPERTLRAMISGLDALPIRIFPIHPSDTPPGCDPYRDSTCHCALGCMIQILAACGIDADRELPWTTPWFGRYQMADGGLNCDGDAYLVAGESPSSMVGTVAPFEAMTLGDPATWTPERRAFVERAAGFLIERRLMCGSQSQFNAAEREREPQWLQPCFPRFYFYDVIRGASALVGWAERCGRELPVTAIAGVVEHLAAAFPDGVIQIQRLGFTGWPTMMRDASGVWTRGHPATWFRLLEVTSAVGEPSHHVTAQWAATRRTLARLIEAGQITEA